ncbi:MAG: hypothetical protein M3441_29460, partial [Chloroflexota bacterium]|nr:hypothetical protein [Chloroflexota bacterium]
NPLNEMDLERSLSALSFIAAQRVGLIDTTGKFSVKGRRNAELHALFTQADAVFERWPVNFENFLDWRRTQHSDSGCGTGLHKDFGTLYPGLYFNLSDVAFDFMRRAFEDYVGRRWSGGYAATIMRRKGAVLNDMKYATKTEARNRLRVDAAYVERLVEAGRLEGLVRMRNRRRMFLIGIASLEKLELEFRESLSVKEAAELLNVEKAAVADLVRHGCLMPHRGPDIDGLPFRKYTRGAVTELLKSLVSRVPPKPDRPFNDAVDFPTALCHLCRPCYGIGHFVQDILDGKINPCGRGSGRGVQCLIFRQKDIKTLLLTRGGAT